MTFYFYDLETSGLDPKWHRVMQFAGQRTDEDFNPVGEPHNILVKLTDEILPDPEAILVTGITPQQTIQDGVTEEEFLRTLHKEVFQPNTCMVGFNSIRFDDEFMRYMLYRNLYDPYAREWQDDKSRWDIIDLVRMTRALRPEGIEWPTNSEGKPTNKLEKLSVANNLEHSKAHDALSDVEVTIDIAKLIKEKQPQLFDHLLKMKNKREVAKLVDPDNPKPVVHTSGKFGSENLNTSVVLPLSPHPTNPNAVLVYDLRINPSEFSELSVDELSERVFTRFEELKEQDKNRLPVKAIHLNKSPAVAPLGVLDEASQERIGLSISKIEQNLKLLSGIKGFSQRIYNAYDKPYEDDQILKDVDGMLYDGFFNDSDKQKISAVHTMDEDSLADFRPVLSDERLNSLLTRFKARNFPKSLTADEKQMWDQYRSERLTKTGPQTLTTYMNRLQKLSADEKLSKEKEFLLQELHLWVESIAPYENELLL